MVAIEYIGKRPEYVEKTYGSGIVFQHGSVVSVDDDLAKKLLRHKDVYKQGNIKSAIKIDIKRSEEDPVKEQDREQDMRDLIQSMPKDAVIDKAMTDYGRKLDKRKSEGALREELTRLIDQYGLID